MAHLANAQGRANCLAVIARGLALVGSVCAVGNEVTWFAKGISSDNARGYFRANRADRIIACEAL